MKVSDAVKDYLEWKSKYQPVAARSYKSYLKRFSRHFKGKDLEDLTIRGVMNYLTDISKIYSPRSIWYMVAILHTFFRYYPGIVNSYHIQYPRMLTKEIRFVTQEDFDKIDALLDEWKYPDVRNKFIHHMLWATGLRVGELCSITLDDIDMKTRSARIVTEKSNKIAYITWDERTHELLIRYLGIRLQRGGDKLIVITQREIQRMIGAVSKKSGLEGITPHKYRHGKAHKMLKCGASIDDIAFVLRHQNPKLTKQMYLRLNREENLFIQQKYLAK